MNQKNCGSSWSVLWSDLTCLERINLMKRLKCGWSTHIGMFYAQNFEDYSFTVSVATKHGGAYVGLLSSIVTIMMLHLILNRTVTA